VRSGRKKFATGGVTPLLYLLPMTKYRALYVNCDTALPSHANHPVGTAKFWGVTLLPPSEPPAHTVTEPVGTRKGDGLGGGGYSIPLIVLSWTFIVDRVGEAILFNETMVLLACRFVVNIVGDSKVVVWIFVVDILGDVMDTPAVMLDVIRVFMLPDKELKLKHPIVLAVIVPLDMNDVDIVLIVAV
jgi:hypothetical protein